MNFVADALIAAGPWGILAAGLMGVVIWVARVDNRLDNLDHHHKGRVPRVEREVAEVRDEVSELKADMASVKATTGHIKEGVDRLVAASDRRERA